jgi:hypothetical protein
MALTLPAPEIVTDPPGGPAALEKPVKIRLASVQTASGAPLAADDIRTLGVFVFRGPLGAEEIWDENANGWTSPAPLEADAIASLKPLGLAPQQGPAPGWSGTLAAAGQTDAAGNARFAKASGGAPAYRLRAFASAVHAGREQRGLSLPSSDVSFVSMADSQRFSIMLDPDDAATAERVRLILRNGAMQPVGYVEIRASGGQEVEIANTRAAGGVLARMTLSADGDIRLSPATGRSIVLEGQLEAERISYLPHGGGPRQAL